MASDIAAKVRDLLTAEVEAAGFDLEELTVTRAGSRSVVRIVVDRDGGIDLDAVAVASRVISDVLDVHEDALPGTYALEVTSPGVDRPLTDSRHWRRNIGRLVTLSRADGFELTGRITAADDTTVTIAETTIPFAGARGRVQIEFNRPRGAAPVETPGYDAIGDGELGVDEFDDRFDDEEVELADDEEEEEEDDA